MSTVTLTSDEPRGSLGMPGPWPLVGAAELRHLSCSRANRRPQVHKHRGTTA